MKLSAIRLSAIIFFFLIFSASRSKGQSFFDSTSFVKKQMMSNSFVFKFNDQTTTFISPASFISIYSANDTVKSCFSGNVRIRKHMDLLYTVVIETSDSIYVFGNLKTVEVKPNQTIEKMQIVGLADWNNDVKHYRMIFSIMEKKKGTSFTYFDLYDFLLTE